MAFPSGQTGLSPDGKSFGAVSSGQTGLSPDGKTFRTGFPPAQLRFSRGTLLWPCNEGAGQRCFWGCKVFLNQCFCIPLRHYCNTHYEE